MSRLSVVIFGATGYTGKYAAVEMARQARLRPGLTWAVAGRSRSKLDDLLWHVADITGEDQSHVRIIVADVGDQESLLEMCKQAQVVANCCGPYRLYGEPVVKAAVEAKTHYVDVTGEPQFIESMQLKYHDRAREAGVYIVSACGFDSIPNDLGVIFLQQNFGGTVNSIESYISTSIPPHLESEARASGVVNIGTWLSLVHGVHHWNELKALRQKLYPTRLPAQQPRLFPRRIIHTRNEKYCVPFPGADNSIVYRTQRRLYEEKKQRPAQFRAYLALDHLTHALALLVAAVFLAIMCKFKFTMNLLIKYPRFFSGGLVSTGGPSEAVNKEAKFKAELYGEGWAEGTDLSGPPDKALAVRVSGTNPGYGFTATALLLSAITILDDRDKMPQPGVLTTGVAFKDTNLIKKLVENGTNFEVIGSKSN